ncbi:MAG: hypothetical protein JRD93_03300 [Deltaproteobacteria bacterium]|nr:hypothetical protein [Deltaproteobacteria bacterium]
MSKYSQKPKYAKYAGYAEAPIHIVYSNTRDGQNASELNNGLAEEKVLESFALIVSGVR